MAAILIVEDEDALRRTMAIALRRHGHQIKTVGSHAEAVEALARDIFDLVVTDLRLPDGDGLMVLRDARASGTEVAALVLTAFGTVDAAVEAMRLGAYDFLQKPFRPDRLALCVERALEHRQLRAELRRRGAALSSDATDPTVSIVGTSDAIAQVKQLVLQAAEARVVLVTGETGTGKELVARAVYAAAGKPTAPFVIVHCGALTESLIESELFGHVAGSFTGAQQARRGLLAEADGGTVFLDEIGEIPLSLQPRLLRFLDTGEIRAVGANREARVTCQVVAATNRDLRADVQSGRMREDLLYRLDVLRIHIPPLRERVSDIEPLARHLVRRAAKRLHRAPPPLSDDVLEALRRRSWPGNVRELRNALERALLVSRGRALEPEMLAAGGPTPPRDPTPPRAPSHHTLADMERQHILDTLASCDGDLKQAVDRLQISRSTLRRKLIEYGHWVSRTATSSDEEPPSSN